MNYAGKFDPKLPAEGSGLHPKGQAHVETITSHATHAPADAIIVPDTQLLFNGEFKRSGVDLILSRDDHELVLQDYFKGEKRAALSSPDGAHLTGDIVNALTGHTQFAQADGSAGAGKVIGHVSKLVGAATAIRNGVSIILNNGDNVEKGDVVQSGSDSTLGITFIDGTVFGLSSNARMVLNEMVYDPNGSNNSTLLSLVAGTISFVAGETAKHGDMKIDTPVATMGIRGTAVLVEIDFNVPGQGGAPDAKFQVLVEPDGTTGSYILFDKTTLTPIATVNQAGQQINISQGQVSVTNAPLPPDVQKLITDVFSLKFTSNDPNPKNLDHFTDTVIPLSLQPIILPNGTTATPVIAIVKTADNGPTSGSNGPASPLQHIDGPPIAAVTSSAVIERAGVTGSAKIDTATGTVNFVDINKGDAPTVSTNFDSFTYQDAQHHDITATLNAQQLADIAAVEVKLALAPDAGNNNNGSTTWTYSIADGAFDFLAAGETLTLTYQARIDNNYAPNDEATVKPFTITITGTNDVPVITSDQTTQHIDFKAGTATPGGFMNVLNNEVTSGTFAFTDPDLTDTHTTPPLATLTSASLALTPGAQPLDLTALEKLAPAPMAVFESALSVLVQTDSTGAGNGSLSWSLVNLPVYLADFIPVGQTLKLTYTITLTDSQGATDTKTVEVDITGANNPAEVWIHTTTDNNDNLWTTGKNWETGNVPVSTDDVIIITDQLHPNTPSYPVTITAGTAAVANSLTMNDFTFPQQSPSQPPLPPVLDIQGANSQLGLGAGSLTIGTTLTMAADLQLNNAGKVNVGTQLELLDQSGQPVVLNQAVISNSGTLNIDTSKATKAGDIQGNASITNTGMIDLKGGTLNVLVDIANSQGNSSGHFTVDTGATLALGTDTNNPSVFGGITGGTVIIDGTLDLQGNNFLNSGKLTNTSGQVNVSGTGNIFSAETVSNTGTASAIDITGTLTAQTGTAITNQDATSGETVESTGKLTLADTSSITGGQVTVDGGTLNLQGTTASLNSGKLTDSSGQVNVSGTGNIFSAETVSNTGTASAIDITGTLTAQTGTAITNQDATSGETVGSAGKLTLADTSSITNGQVTVDGGTLNLQGTTASLNSGKLTNSSGQVNVSGTGNIFSAETVSNTGTASAIDITGTLTAQTGTAITNQDATSGETVGSIGTLTLADSSSITNGQVTVDGGTLNLQGTTASLNSGKLTNSSGQVNVSGTGNIFSAETVSNTGTASAIDITGTLTAQTGTAITNQDATSGETVGSAGTLTLADSSSITGGQVTVDSGGKLNLQGTTASLNSGKLTNSSGQVNVSGTGNIFSAETVSNTGSASAIDITGTLTAQTGTAITNQDATSGETVGSAGTLTLADSSSITGGQVTVDGGGKLNLQGTTASLNSGKLTNSSGQVNVSGTGNIFSAETVSNTGSASAIDITGTLTAQTGTAITNQDATSGETVGSAGTLTLADSSSITGGQVTVDSGGTLNLQGTTASLNSGKLTNSSGQVNVSGTGNIFSAETVSNTGSASAIDITGTLTAQTGTAITNKDATSGETVGSAGTLTLADSSSITGGQLVNLGDVYVEASTGALLDGVNVDNSGGTIYIDANGPPPPSPAKLIIDDGTSIKNGSVDIGSVGTLEVLGGGATLTGGVTVTVNSGGIVQVDDGATLTLNATIHGGNINDGTISGGPIASTGSIDVTGATKFDSNATLTNGYVKVESGVTLTLDNVTVTGTTFTDPGTIKVDSGNSNTLTLAGTDTITGGQFAFGEGKVALVNGGGIRLSGVSIGNLKAGDPQVTLTISATYASNLAIAGGVSQPNGTIQVTGALSAIIADLASGLTFNPLSTSTVLTMTIADTSGDTAFRTLTVSTPQTGSPSFQVTNASGAIINGNLIDIASNATVTLSSDQVFNAPVTGPGNLTVEANGLLKLVHTGTHGGIITDNGTIEIAGHSGLNGGSLNIDVNGFLTVDSTKLLTLNHMTVTGGTVTDGGTIEIIGSSAINGAHLNQGGVTVDSGQTLTLDGTTVTGTAFTDTASGAVIQIDDGTTLTLSGATINGGTLNVFGELDSTGTSLISGATIVNPNHIKVISGTLTIDPAPVTNTGTIEVMGSSTLVLSGEIITNNGTTNSVTVNGIIQVDYADPTHFATLDLEDSTIDGGALTVSGVLDLTGASFITGATINYSGTIDVTAGTLIIDATSTLINTGGTLETSGGNLIIEAAIKGNLEIKGGAVLELGASSIDSSVTVTFDPASTGTLKLDHSENFSGKVAGLDDNTIDLVDISSVGNHGAFVPATVTYLGDKTGGTLTIVSNVDPTQVAHIQLTGDYTGVTWTAANDGNGGTSVTEAPGAITTGLTNGNAVEGTAAIVSVTDGGHSVTPVSYQWLLDGNKITNAIGASYTPTESDEGHALSVTVTYIDALTNTEITTQVLAGTVAENPHETLSVTINGSPVHGTAITATVSDPDAVAGDMPASGITYTWYADGKQVYTAVDNNSYTPTESDEGKALTVTASFHDPAGNLEQSTSTASTAVGEIAGGDLVATLSSNTPHQGASISVASVTDGGTTVAVGDTHLSYQWQVGGVNASGAGATTSTYTPTEADEGKTLSVVVSYGNDPSGNDVTTATATTAVGEIAGGDLVATLNSNTPHQGASISVASVTDGGTLVAVGDTHLSYQWQVGGVNASGAGATTSTYTPTEADEGKTLSVVVSYGNDPSGNDVTTATATTAVGEIAGGDLVAMLSSNTPHQGASISVASVTDGGTTVAVADTHLSYQWQVGGVNASGAGATTSTYTPTEADEGKTLSVVVTYGNDPSGNDVTTSTATTAVGEIAGGDLVATLSSNTPHQGASISVASVTDGGTTVAVADTHLSYQWQVGGVNASGAGATTSTYTPTEADEGKTLSVVVTYGNDPSGNDVTTATATTAVGEIAGGDLVATLNSNTPHQGASISVASVTDGGTLVAVGDTHLSYQWQVGGVNASGAGATTSTYTPTEADEGKTLSVVVSYGNDPSGNDVTTATATTAVGELAGGDLVATLDTQTAQQGVAIHVTGVADGGITVTSGLSYTWEVSSNGGSSWTTVGSNANSYTPAETDEGKLLQLVVSLANDPSGPESSTYSLGMVATDLVATLDSTTAKQNVAIHVTGVRDGGTTVTSGLSYTWEVSSNGGSSWTTVGSNANTYTPVAADDGKLLQVIVTYADAGENESTTDTLGIVASKYWNGGSHNWQSGNHWSPSGVPTSSDDVTVDATSGTYTLTIADDAAAHSLTVNYAGATVEIQGGNTLTLGGNLTIASGTFLIDSGGALKDIAASATITGSFTDNGTVEAAGGKLEIASAVNSGEGTFKVDAGATLEFVNGVSSGQTVTFNSTTGMLKLDNAQSFHGVVSGLGTQDGTQAHSDQIDLANINYYSTSFSEKFDSGHDTLTVSDGTNTAVIQLTGSYTSSSFHVVADGNLIGGVSGTSGTIVYDPPASGSQAVGPVVAHDPGPAPNQTIVASVPNETLTGTSSSDTFVFNFTAVGHGTVTDFHPATDTLQFSAPIFANAQAVLNAMQDDGHGNTVVALDAHDTITLTGVLKAQLHTTDFHVV